MDYKRKVLVKDLNPVLVCTLCEGYLIDATVLTDCLHVFCRGCIIKYFENCKTACPNCNLLYKKKNQICFRSDPQIQNLVYKLVPSLYSKELQRKEDFYRSTNVRASSSCSDDSVIERETDQINHTENVTSNSIEKPLFFSPDDSISLSLEYYKSHLDKTSPVPKKPVPFGVSEVIVDDKVKELEGGLNNNSEECVSKEPSKDLVQRRYLQCPAAVAMKHLQKFIRMKYGVTADHRVDIIYEGEILPNYFSLIDVAYTFKWSRTKPMRFFYRIFTPQKIRPIKIINTTSSSGSKQLQIVQVTDKIEKKESEKTEASLTNLQAIPAAPTERRLTEESEDQRYHKEQLMANLQLQSKHKKHRKSPEREEKEPCVYEYVEPDQEELKRFAEKRDKEWMMQKKMEEKNERHNDKHGEHYVKKRKKSKHSKSDSVHKKRKLHAEITSNEEEDLKLKVKITPHNGHKHKYHKVVKTQDKTELSTKEKLLQMRQVRHKQVNTEEKTVQTTLPTLPETPIKQSIVDRLQEKLKMKEKTESESKIESNKVEPLKKPIVAPKPVQEKIEPIKLPVENKKVPEKDNTLKTFQSYTEKYNKEFLEKLKQHKLSQQQARVNIEKKINPQKISQTVDKAISPYPPGFTVSKVETGLKRKTDANSKVPEKRPSLEITLINPTGSSPNKPNDKIVQKRPLPPTIPLERIRKSLNFNTKSGISIIAKNADTCDNIGALDLSNKSPENSPVPKNPPVKTSPSIAKSINGIQMIIANHRLSNVTAIPTTTSSDKQLSNLQMLSKVATEHSTLKNNNNQKRPQVPNLQTIPSTVQSLPASTVKNLPKLTEINKSQFKMGPTQIRTQRPNLNQNIRNIPNPSLLVRQQNQNRLNSTLSNIGAVERDVSSSKVTNVMEKQEISV